MHSRWFVARVDVGCASAGNLPRRGEALAAKITLRNRARVIEKNWED